MKNDVKKIQLLMRKNGFDPMALADALRSTTVQQMTMKERCEHINKMKVPYGVLISTPKHLLKKWLGVEMNLVLSWGPLAQAQIGSNKYITNSRFHISHCSKSTVEDCSIIFVEDGRDADDTFDEITTEKVIDLSCYDGPLTTGLGPKAAKNFSVDILPFPYAMNKFDS